jgi:hypothetical protein
VYLSFDAVQSRRQPLGHENHGFLPDFADILRARNADI